MGAAFKRERQDYYLSRFKLTHYPVRAVTRERRGCARMTCHVDFRPASIQAAPVFMLAGRIHLEFDAPVERVGHIVGARSNQIGPRANANGDHVASQRRDIVLQPRLDVFGAQSGQALIKRGGP